MTAGGETEDGTIRPVVPSRRPPPGMLRRRISEPVRLLTCPRRGLLVPDLPSVGKDDDARRDDVEIRLVPKLPSSGPKPPEERFAVPLRPGAVEPLRTGPLRRRERRMRESTDTRWPIRTGRGRTDPSPPRGSRFVFSSSELWMTHPLEVIAFVRHANNRDGGRKFESF